MFPENIDQIDIEILELLKQNCRMQWKEIGAQVHLSGPAVATRVQKMESLGIIEGYSARVNPQKLGQTVTALITVFMKTTAHTAFQNFLTENPAIIEAHRISGGGCYFLKAAVPDTENLKLLLDKILIYGNYQVNISIDRFK